MKPLIDADVLRYELGACCEYKDEEGNERVREFDFFEELFHNKVDTICNAVEATEPPTFYLTVGETEAKMLGRKKPYILNENFRIKLAKTAPYKGNRNENKPYHYANITAYLLGTQDVVLANGVEADDLMAMDATSMGDKAIICSRDKDLRQVPGWHYSWECGKQGEIGPVHFDRKGYINRIDNGKIFGGGEMFLLYQHLVGDSVDNIKGCPGIGPAKAFKLLHGVEKRREAYQIVFDAYKENKKIEGEKVPYLEEQGQLLYLLRSFDDKWQWPYPEMLDE